MQNFKYLSRTNQKKSSPMAKVKYTAVVADMRNKLNGSVFSKNRGGAYVRTKVTPVNGQTSFQTVARNRLTTFAQAWRGLTDTQRAAWNGAVSNFTGTDIFGDVKQPSGAQLYNKLNINLALASIATISVPPLPSTVAQVTTLTPTATAGTPTFSIAYAASPVPAGSAYLIEVTPQLSPGVKFVKSKYVILTTLAAAAATPYNALTAYNARFGTLVAGTKIGVRLSVINTVTGQRGLPIQSIITVGA